MSDELSEIEHGEPGHSEPECGVAESVGMAAQSSRPQRLVIALISAGAVIVALGILAVFLAFRGPAGVSTADAEPAAAPFPSASAATPEPTLKPTPVSATPTAPPAAPPVAAPPAAPALPAAPAPPAPPALPEPPAPMIPPLSISSMDAIVSGACTEKSHIVLSWSTTGAVDDSTNIRVRTGGGTPVFNELWEGYPATGSNTFNLDCTRPIWYFTLTVTNGTETKTGLLTFAHGTTAGWSSVAP